MNKEQDFASDSDDSDEDFHPDNLAGESAVSEEEDSELNELEEGTENFKETPVKRKKQTKKVKKNEKPKHDDDSEDEPTHTLRRATRQKDDSQVNGNGKGLEKNEIVSDEEDKSRSNALWADFLKNDNSTASVPKVASKFEENPSSSSSNKNDASENKTDVSKKAQSTKSLAPKVEDNKIVLTEVVDFAGEEVHIVREVDASSIKENKAAALPQAKKQPFSRIMPGVGIKRTMPTGSGSGLGSVLNQLGKKKKLSVLEKSQMDWKSFKQTEGIDEQLQTFNKGKDGYLERQDFLQRTDLRQFEIEKNLRQTTRRPF